MADPPVLDLTASPAREEHVNLITPPVSPEPEDVGGLQENDPQVDEGILEEERVPQIAEGGLQENVAPQVAEGGPEERVPQVDEGGPGPAPAVDRAVMQMLCRTLGGLCVQASDMIDPDDIGKEAFGDLNFWLYKVLITKSVDPETGAEIETLDPARYQLKIITVKAGEKPRLEALFPLTKGDARFLSIYTHSAPYPVRYVDRAKNDPRQLMSFGENCFQSFVDVARIIREKTVRKANKYHLFLLGCCHGYHMVSMLKDVMADDGVLIYFGEAGEAQEDGVASGLISEFGEGLMEIVKERLDAVLPMDYKDIFETAYVEAGYTYLAPAGKEDTREPNDDFKYMQLVLDKSINEAKRDPKFVLHYTFAGKMHALMRGVELVTPELKARRAVFIAEKQREADLAGADGGGADGAAPATGKAAKRRRA